MAYNNLGLWSWCIGYWLLFLVYMFIGFLGFLGLYFLVYRLLVYIALGVYVSWVVTLLYRCLVFWVSGPYTPRFVLPPQLCVFWGCSFFVVFGWGWGVGGGWVGWWWWWYQVLGIRY